MFSEDLSKNSIRISVFLRSNSKLYYHKPFKLIEILFEIQKVVRTEGLVNYKQVSAQPREKYIVIGLMKRNKLR